MSMLLPVLALSVAQSMVHEEVRGPLEHSIEVGLGTGGFLAGRPGGALDIGQGTALSVGLRMAYLPWAALGVEVEAMHLAAQVGDQDAGGYGLRGHLIAQGPWRLSPFVLAGGGALGRPTSGPAALSPSLHWGAGLRWYTHKNLHVRAEARHLADVGSARHDVEVTVGIGFTLFAAAEERGDAGRLLGLR